MKKVLLAAAIALAVYCQGYTYRVMDVTFIYKGNVTLADHYGNRYVIFADDVEIGDELVCYCHGYSNESLEIRDYWKKGSR